MDTFYILEEVDTNLQESCLIIEKRVSNSLNINGKIVSSGQTVDELVDNCSAEIPHLNNLPDYEMVNNHVYKNSVSQDVFSQFSDAYKQKRHSEFDHAGIPFH